MNLYHLLVHLYTTSTSETLRMKLEWSTKTWNSCATTGEHPWMVNGKNGELNWIDLQIPPIWRFKRRYCTGFGYFTCKWNPMGIKKRYLSCHSLGDSTFKFWHESSMSPLDPCDVDSGARVVQSWRLGDDLKDTAVTAWLYMFKMQHQGQ